MSNPPRVTSRPQAGAEGSAQDPSARAALARISLGRVFRAEGTNFYLLLGTTVFLVGFGLVMVLSSSSVESYLEDQGFFGSFLKQSAFALFGIPMMLLVSRLPISFWKWLAPFAMIGSSFLQALVVFTPLGVGVGGNTNWIELGFVQFQPSELIKVSLVIWLGLIVSRKEELLDDWKHGLAPILLTSGAAIGLVLLGDDLGTTFVLAAMLMGGLFFAGVRLRMLGMLVLAGGLLFAIMAVTSPSRVTRLMTFAGGCEDLAKQMNECWQSTHGDFALANGGILGAGLGNSKAKWSWLPAAHNDYIFAIIGEELGLIGAIVVIGLFVLLAVAFARVLRSARTLFAKTVTAAVMVWVIGQACVNIGVVLGVFPVLGVPLPLVSAGGTALLTTLVAIGVVLSVARDPEAPARAAARAAARKARASERAAR